MADSLRPASRHQRASDEQFLADAAVPGPVRRLYAAAVAAVAAGRVHDVSDTVDAVAAELDAQPLSPFVADLEAEHRSAVVAWHTESNHLRNHLAKSAEGATAAHGAYVDAAARADAASARAAELESHLAKSADAAAAAHAAYVHANGRADAAIVRTLEVEAHLTKSAEAAAAAHGAYVDAVGRADAADVRAAELSARVTAARDALDRLQLLTQAQACRLTAAVAAGIERAVRAADASSRSLAGADKRVAQTDRELAGTRAELSAAYRTRDTLGESLRNTFASRLWTWGTPGRFLARAAGLLRVGGDKLVPIADGMSRGEAAGTWHGVGTPQFLIPLAPIVGWARLRVTLKSSVASKAALYFDTGSGFHQKEHLELTSVAGDTQIDRMVALRKPTYLIRFDPVQAVGEWSIESFALEPMSAAWFNTAAVAGERRQAGDRPGHSPAVAVDRPQAAVHRRSGASSTASW